MFDCIIIINYICLICDCIIKSYHSISVYIYIYIPVHCWWYSFYDWLTMISCFTQLWTEQSNCVDHPNCSCKVRQIWYNPQDAFGDLHRVDGLTSHSSCLISFAQRQRSIARHFGFLDRSGQSSVRFPRFPVKKMQWPNKQNEWCHNFQISV